MIYADDCLYPLESETELTLSNIFIHFNKKAKPFIEFTVPHIRRHIKIVSVSPETRCCRMNVFGFICVYLSEYEFLSLFEILSKKKIKDKGMSLYKSDIWFHDPKQIRSDILYVPKFVYTTIWNLSETLTHWDFFLMRTLNTLFWFLLRPPPYVIWRRSKRLSSRPSPVTRHQGRTRGSYVCCATNYFDFSVKSPGVSLGQKISKWP